MHFKLIIAFVNEKMTNKILDATRLVGATGSTVINKTHGKDVLQNKTFFSLTVDNQFDTLFLLVEEHLSHEILETINSIGKFDDSKGNEIAFQIDTNDAVGVCHQIEQLAGIVEQRI